MFDGSTDPGHDDEHVDKLQHTLLDSILNRGPPFGRAPDINRARVYARLQDTCYLSSLRHCLFEFASTDHRRDDEHVDKLHHTLIDSDFNRGPPLGQAPDINRQSEGLCKTSRHVLPVKSSSLPLRFASTDHRHDDERVDKLQHTLVYSDFNRGPPLGQGPDISVKSSSLPLRICVDRSPPR